MSTSAALHSRPLQGRTAVLLDPHPLWLETVAQLLEQKGFDVIGKTRTAEAALALVDEARPDVLVAEITLSDDDAGGLECIARARRARPELKAIVLSAHTDPKWIDAAFASGAVAYVVKTAEAEDIHAAIRQAFDHSIFLSPSAAQRRAPEVDRESNGARLTNREREILKLAAEGFSNARLARELWVTEQTVKFHLSNIYRKLGVANRTEASRWAQRNGLAPAGRPGDRVPYSTASPPAPSSTAPISRSR